MHHSTQPHFTRKNLDIDNDDNNKHDINYSHDIHTESRAKESMMEEVQQTPMAQPKVQGVLGTLWLVAKKTGLDMQSFPIDADTVTIGR